MPKSRAQLQREEDELISMFSSDVGSSSSAPLILNGLLAAAAPLFVFIRIQQVDVASNWFILLPFTLAAAYVLQYTYKKGKSNLKAKIAVEIHNGVSKEVNDSLSANERKVLTSQQKNDRILRRQSDIADQIAQHQATFQTNLAYYALVIISSFFMFGTWEPVPNFLGSMIFANGLIFAVAALEKN